MSVIQQIQEKYAKLMAIIIALALMIFVVMLAFENGGNLFRGGDSTTVGRVNGKKIDYTEFLQKVNRQEKSMEQSGYYGSGAQLQMAAVDAAWNEEVNGIIENSEYSKLGIAVGKKEMGDVLYGPNAPQDLKRIFTDTATGIFNGQLAKQQIDAVIKSKPKTPDQLAQRDQTVAFINYHETARLRDKYNSLMTNSVNYPKWLVEKQIADNSQMAKLSLVRYNYADDKDSTIKVTDKEIQDYLDKHKKQYKQQESRSISYVAFSTLPTAADTLAAKNRVLALKPEFDSVKNVQRFLAAQGVTTFADTYFKGSTIQIAAKDSIFKLPINGVYGPYIDGGSFSLAKLLAIRQEPEMVKVRHILVETAKLDQQTRQMNPTRDTVTARKMIDSIRTAIAGGSNFDTLCLKLSEDPGRFDRTTGKFNGGVYDSVKSGTMVAEFNEYIFGNAPGSKGIVKTEYGFHYIEVLQQKGAFSPSYKIAYLSKPIEASSETEINASNDAAQFAGKSRDQKSFDANAEILFKEKGINKGIGTDITPSSYFITGLGQSRTLVKNIYKADIGEVLEPEKVGENYAVVLVSEINDEGTMPVAKARSSVEPILRKKKIAEKMKQKVGAISTLETAATAFGNKPVEPIDSLRMTGTQTHTSATTIASEPKVIGAVFNAANKGKVIPELIEGSNGVYVVRVDNVTTTSVADANVVEKRKSKYVEGKQQQQAPMRLPVAILREAATIKDRRINFF